MEWLGVIGNLASVVGIVLTFFALRYAKTAAEAAMDARRMVRRANANQVLAKLGDGATLLQATVENGLTEEAKVRARDLVAEISKFRLHFERFLSVDSLRRIDEAREQVSVMSRILATQGVPSAVNEKKKMLKICHEDVVVVLNEESGRILAAIEREDENA